MEEGEDQDNLAQEGDAAIEGEADPTATEKKRGGRRNLNKVWDAGDTKGFPSGEDELEYEDVDTVTRKMYLSRLLDITVKAPQASFFVKWILARVDGQHRILWFATRLLHALIVSTLRVVTLDNIEQYMLIPSTNLPADRLIISQTVIHRAFSLVSAKGTNRPSNSKLDQVFNSLPHGKRANHRAIDQATRFRLSNLNMVLFFVHFYDFFSTPCLSRAGIDYIV
ncbi:hypothetical protein V1524DRAFT_465769 [Lipomyces starkeyi]